MKVPLIFILFIGFLNVQCRRDSGATVEAVAQKAKLITDKLPSMTPELLKLYARPAPGEEGHLQLESLNYNFGEISSGAEFETEFHFKNSGPGPLRVFTVRAHCGCTLGKTLLNGKFYDFGSPIGAGDVGCVKVVLNTTGVEGKKSVFVDILTNDPAIPETMEAEFGMQTIQVEANVIPYFTTDSGNSLVNYGKFAGCNSVSRSILLSNSRNEAFEVVGASEAGGSFTTSFEPTDVTHKSWILRITTKENALDGPFVRTLLIKTRGASPPSNSGTSITLSGLARGLVDMEPANGAHFQVIPRGQEKEIMIAFVNESQAPLNICNIQFFDPATVATRPAAHWAPPREEIARHIGARLESDGSGRRANLYIKISGEAPPGAFSAILALNTGVAGGPESITIPVTGFVRP